MSFAEFLASIVKSTAWPAVAVLAIVLFRGPIKEMLESISELKIGKDGVTGKWERTAAEIWEGLKPEPTEVTKTDRTRHAFIPPTTEANDRSFNTGRIVTAWANVENALQKKIAKTGRTHPRTTPAALIQDATNQGVITETQSKSLRGLYALRNLAAHGKESDTSDARVNEYLAMADAMTTVLDITD